MSESIISLECSLSKQLLIYILSIKVAVFSVILVTLVIVGRNPYEAALSMKFEASLPRLSFNVKRF